MFLALFLMLSIFPNGVPSVPGPAQPAAARSVDRGIKMRASSFPYEGATMGRRLGEWVTTRDAINTVWFQSADQLVARSHDVIRKDSWASKAIDEWVSNAIGTGIKPQSQHPNQATRKKIQKLWDAWTDVADADGNTDFYGLQALTFRSMVEGGECFGRFRPRLKSDGLPVPLQIQTMEAEQLPWYLTRPTPDTPKGRAIRMSIEFDQLGRRTAYYFYSAHPGERLFFTNWLDLNRVPAEYIMHVYRPLRIGQIRGVPWMANALVRMWELDQYDDAELLRKKFAAMLMAFITRQNQDDTFFPNATSSTVAQGGSAVSTEQGIQVATLEAGTVQELEPGEKIEFNQPADVGGSYEKFERVQLLRIAAGLGISYEMLTGDHSQTNFSSIRAGILSFRRLCEQIQYGVFVYKFCKPTWKAFIEAAAMDGSLSASDYAKNPADYLAVQWHMPKWAWVDPEKDIKAELISVRSGFKARSDVINEMGDSAERVDEQIAADNVRADDFGLVLDSDPRKTILKGLNEGEKSAQAIEDNPTGKTQDTAEETEPAPTKQPGKKKNGK